MICEHCKKAEATRTTHQVAMVDDQPTRIHHRYCDACYELMYGRHKRNWMNSGGKAHDNKSNG